jgi:hypothetical protein
MATASWCVAAYLICYCRLHALLQCCLDCHDALLEAAGCSGIMRQLSTIAEHAAEDVGMNAAGCWSVAWDATCQLQLKNLELQMRGADVDRCPYLS